MNKVRWGLLSTADINRQLIPAIRASMRGELVAVASRTPEKAQDYATRWEIPKAFGSYQAMIDSGSIDAVYIGLPNHLHAEWSIRAMQAGLHVLCEKPLALSVVEIDNMIAASNTFSTNLAEAFMYRHHPQTKIVGEWIQSGKLGEISSIYGTYIYPIKNPEDIRFVPEYGGGSLWDLGVYPVSYAQYILGSMPEWVLGDQHLGSNGVDESFAGYMRYSSSCNAQFTCSFRSPWYMYFEIIGTEGNLILSRPFSVMDKGRSMMFYPNGNDPYEVPVPEKQLYLGEVEDLEAAILDGSDTYINLLESRKHIQTVEALYDSAQAHEVVQLRQSHIP